MVLWAWGASAAGAVVSKQGSPLWVLLTVSVQALRGAGGMRCVVCTHAASRPRGPPQGDPRRVQGRRSDLVGGRRDGRAWVGRALDPACSERPGQALDADRHHERGHGLGSLLGE